MHNGAGERAVACKRRDRDWHFRTTKGQETDRFVPWRGKKGQFHAIKARQDSFVQERRVPCLRRGKGQGGAVCRECVPLPRADRPTPTVSPIEEARCHCVPCRCRLCVASHPAWGCFCLFSCLFVCFRCEKSCMRELTHC